MHRIGLEGRRCTARARGVECRVAWDCRCAAEGGGASPATPATHVTHTCPLASSTRHSHLPTGTPRQTRGRGTTGSSSSTRHSHLHIRGARAGAQADWWREGDAHVVDWRGGRE